MGTIGSPGAGWTDERIEVLKKLWAEGYSCSQIATQLGWVSRNAVIGKVTRLGLGGRGQPTAPSSRVAPAPKRPAPRPAAQGGDKHLGPHAAKVLNAQIAAAYVEPEVVGLQAIPEEERPRHFCRWPIGDPRSSDFNYCGRQAAYNDTGRPKPYCTDHYASERPNRPSSQPPAKEAARLASWLDNVEGRKGKRFAEGL